VSRIPLRALLVALLIAAPLPAFAAEGGLQLLPELPPFLSGVAAAIGAPVGWGTLILLLFFPALLVPLNALLFKPLLRLFDEREDRIAGTRARAEKLERNAAETLHRYESALRETREAAELERRGTLDAVRRESHQETAAARGEAEARIESARREVGAALESARSGLRAQAEELARQAASQVLGRAL